MSAATAGQTICLAAGDYGSWSGTNKAITVRAATGAAVTMSFDFGTGDSSFTLGGIRSEGGMIADGARNITVRDSAFTGQVTVRDTAEGSNIVFDHNTHNNISGSETSQRFLAQGGGLTIRNSHLEGGGSDGIRLATSRRVIVEDNLLLNINEDESSNHTDMIQWYGGSNATVRRNLFKQTTGDTQVMGAYDGTAGNRIKDNVVDVRSRPWAVELYSDDGSVVRHNTFVNRACSFNLPCGIISISRKSKDDAGARTRVYDNVATEVAIGGGSSVARRDHNMLSRNVRSGDFLGTPVFVGGTYPTSYSGYRLVPGSPGHTRASDGLAVGIR